MGGQVIECDICVIGGGSGGLSVAAGASQMGAATVLVEKGRMGGDCLNTGCVPSKALLAAGHAAEGARRAARFGVRTGEPAIDAQGVFDHVRATIAAIAPTDSVARFEGLGVRVVQAAGRFVDRATLEAGDVRIRARRFVVATGSSPTIPPIPGLAEVPFDTNETLFERPGLPAHLIVVGGGPIGLEMAQAHRRLGCAASVLEMASILPRDDPELVEVVRGRLLAEGVDLREGTRVEAVGGAAGAVSVRLGDGTVVAGDRLLIATGRRPNVDGLGLEAAGIAHSPRGIVVDDRLRTSNRRVFAIGDVIGGYQFTHMAGHHAGIVLRNALFRLPARVDNRAVPWVTYTDPELAQVGMGEAEARDRHGRDLRILRWPFAENDRARAEGEIDGLVKVLVTRRGRILGAAIAGPRAGELIQTWCLALSAGVKVGQVASMIAPYPTLGEIARRAAGSFFAPALFSERTRRVVRFLARFG